MSKPEQTVLPDLHAAIMNIAAPDKVKAELDGAPKGFYLLGHRDARHAAAELACAAQAEIERLTAERDEGAEKVLVAFLEREAALADARLLREALEDIRWADCSVIDGASAYALTQMARAALAAAGETGK